MHIMLLKVCCALHSAVAAGIFNWPMVDLFNRDKSFYWQGLILSGINEKEGESVEVQNGSCCILYIKVMCTLWHKLMAK